MAARRLIQGLTSPWSLGFSIVGASYGLYHIWDSTQSGTKYDLHEDLTGKTYIITGASSGIGQVYCRQCDLNDFDSIRQFVQKLSKGKFELDRIDGVVHNAATMDAERNVNKDGIEKTLATNHMGSFLLTALLLDKLLAQNHPVRMVFLNTNIIDRKCDLDFEDLNAEHRKKYDGFEVYKQSKLAAAMFAKELSEKVKETNVSVTVADPGRTKSALSAQMDHQKFFLSRWLLKIVSFGMGERRTEKAVRPVLYALCDPDMANMNGIFIDRERVEQNWNANVENAELRQKLWDTTVVWTKLDQHMAQLKQDLGEVASSLEEPIAVAGVARSWKRLWLW